jgi:hypothetical protein
MTFLPHKCDFCKKWKFDVKPRLDWFPARSVCDECFDKWWNDNKDELG